MKDIIKVLTVVGALFAPSIADAQVFPAKPVTLIVPYGPGASNDVFGRFLAESLSKQWKKPVVVENMAGAGGSIGMASVAKAPPDGYKLLWASSTFSTNAAAQKNLPFDFAKDLQPIAKVGDGELIIVTGSRVPMKTIADLVREAKARTIFYGSTGPASTPTFLSKLLMDVTGINMEAANYKGGAEALIDLVGGRIDLYIGTVTTTLPAIQAKTVTPVAVLSKTRSATLPDVPTIAEAGYPAAEASIWWGVFAPSGTSKDIVNKINADVTAVMKTAEAADMLNKQGGNPATMSVDDFTLLVRAELAKWKALAEKFKIVAD